MLVENWKKFWKFWSVQLGVIGIALMWLSDTITYAWTLLPPSMAMHMPHGKTIATVVFAIGLLARVIKQEKLNGEAK